jgi:hypothetical protein
VATDTPAAWATSLIRIVIVFAIVITPDSSIIHQRCNDCKLVEIKRANVQQEIQHLAACEAG